MDVVPWFFVKVELGWDGSQVEMTRHKCNQEAGDKPNVVVATFETSALELLFPFPQLRGCIFPNPKIQNITGLACMPLLEIYLVLQAPTAPGSMSTF